MNIPLWTSFDKGNLAEAKIIAACLANHWLVSIPFGTGCSYDIIIDTRSRLLRCQIKTATLRGNGTIYFNLRSNVGRTIAPGKRIVSRDYKGLIDVFGVYSPDLDQCFIVPVEETGKSRKYLRVEPMKDSSNVRNCMRVVMAERYLISDKVQPWSASTCRRRLLWL